MLLAVFTVVFALGLVQKYPCGQANWANSVDYSKMCYSDVPPLYTGRGFAEHQWPYSDDSRYSAMEYPVLISYLAWVSSEVTSVFASGPSQEVRSHTAPEAIWGLAGMNKEVNTYFLVTAFLLFLCGLGAVFFLAGASPGRPWDAMAFAASPAVLLAGLVNWDLLAVLFTAGALWAWARGRPVLAGVMVGLGFATKLYPLFLLGAFLVDAVRRRRPDLVAASAVAAGVTWLLVNAPALATSPERWKVFWSFNSQRGADLGSLWLVLSQRGHDVSPHTVNVVSGFLFAAACAGILALGLRARHRPEVAQIAFLVVAAFLVVNKVYSPQYVLWLLPLAVLARPRWRDLLLWQACEVLYFGAIWLDLGGWITTSSENHTPYQVAILVRVLGELYLMAVVVRDIWFATPALEEGGLEDIGPSDVGPRPESADQDLVHLGRGEPHPDRDRVADLGHGDA